MALVFTETSAGYSAKMFPTGTIQEQVRASARFRNDANSESGGVIRVHQFDVLDDSIEMPHEDRAGNESGNADADKLVTAKFKHGFFPSSCHAFMFARWGQAFQRKIVTIQLAWSIRIRFASCANRKASSCRICSSCSIILNFPFDAGANEKSGFNLQSRHQASAIFLIPDYRSQM
jgi:hypothetical protein